MCDLVGAARSCISARVTESLSFSTFGDFVETSCLQYVCYLLEVARACISVRVTTSLRFSTFGDFVEMPCFSTCASCEIWRAPASMFVLRNLYVSVRLVMSLK